MKNTKTKVPDKGRTTKGTDGWPQFTYTAEDLAHSKEVAAALVEGLNKTSSEEQE